MPSQSEKGGCRFQNDAESRAIAAASEGTEGILSDPRRQLARVTMVSYVRTLPSEPAGLPEE